MQWYYSKGAVQLGPISEAELNAKIASGEITSSDMVWKDGMSDWVPLSRVPELAGKSQAPLQSPPPSIPAEASSSPYVPPVSPPAVNYSGQPVPTYLWQSILVTVLCCPPFGIPAIVYAAKVGSLEARGDIKGAQDASKSAKKWAIIALVGWVVVTIGYAILIAVAAASAPPPVH